MEQKNNTHTLNIENRSHAQITGVLEVLSATEKGTTIKLTDGILQIGGSGLRVEKLSPEEHTLVLNGTITKVEYSEQIGGKSFFKKLFK